MKRILFIWAIALSCIAQETVWVVNAPNTSVVGKSHSQALAEGLVDGYSFIDKFGENPDIDTGTDPEDVWDAGGLYIFSATADIDQLSCSFSPQNNDIEIQGLDANWDLVTQTATLDGQDAVTLTTPLIRVFRMKNIGSTALDGDVYLSTNSATLTAGVPTASATRATIMTGNEQTLMCIYTVPAGKTGYFVDGWVSASRAGNAISDVSIRAREFGGVFQVKGKVSIASSGSSAFSRTYPVPLAFSEKTDIIYRVDSVSANNSGISGGFTVILKDN